MKNVVRLIEVNCRQEGEIAWIRNSGAKLSLPLSGMSSDSSE